jgi:tetratricopeptide (TPR) repeat protein
MNKGLKLSVMAVVLATFLLGPVFTVSAQKKQQEQTNQTKATDDNRLRGADLDAIITKYEELLAGCAVRKSDRCADLMYTLGSLYYDQARDRFSLATQQYERTKRQGKPPVPDYSKSIRMYWQLSREYPTFPKLPDAYYQMSQNYLVAGHLDTARIILEQLSQRFPNSPRVSAAQFRLGELAFMDNNFNKAYEHFKKVRKDQIDIISWEMNQYRLAECAYNTGNFSKAAEYFLRYVDACDNGEYTKKAFREMALKYAEQAAKQAEAQAAKQAEEQAAKEAERAAVDAMPTVLPGTGYDKVQWGASVESVKNVYRNLTVVEKNGDMIKLGHKNIGKGISERSFNFVQDKLIAVSVKYEEMSGEDADILVEKLIPIYGKTDSKKIEQDKIVGNQFGMETTTYTWEYNKKMKITFEKIRLRSGDFENNQRQLKQQGMMGEAYAELFNQMLNQMIPNPYSVIIKYNDMVATERLQRENAERAKKKAEEDKKKRSDGLGL